ncbi:pleckstrin homology domain-containing family G member 7-like isoform X2 [Liolophura sinensis]
MPQIHPKKMLIKRNTVADFACSRPGSNTDEKKTRQAFSFRKLRRSRSKDSIVQLGDVLSQMKTSVFKDNHLAAFKDLHWSDLMNSWDKEKKAEMSPGELKRREAVWELFKSECVFLIDHLMVLKHCFLEPLKNVQVEGFLMYAEPEALFGNLDELCYVSYTFSKEFIAALVKHTSDTDFGSTKILIKAFQKFSSLSRDAGVYHTYCLNYMNALNYLEQLRRKDDFCEFEKFCEQDMRCHRLQLTDLLVAPMQHCTKLPLLLSNIRKYTEDIDERTQLTESIQTVENSLKQLEDKMKWVKNYERVQEIQQMLVWPPITELDSKAYIPEFLKSTLIKQPCERLLANPKRQLLHEGPLSMIESGKGIDVHLMLFDDILLLAKIKKQPKKSEHSMLVVHRQPIPLDRFRVHEIGSLEAVVHGLKLGFVLVHSSRYQQIIGVYTLQTSNDSEKNTWLSQLKDAQADYEKTHKEEINSKPLVSFQSQDSTNAILVEEVPKPTGPANSPTEVSAAHRSRMKALRLTRGKSRSMDAGELMLCDKL